MEFMIRELSEDIEDLRESKQDTLNYDVKTGKKTISELEIREDCKKEKKELEREIIANFSMGKLSKTEFNAKISALNSKYRLLNLFPNVRNA
jgi:hypothetical protein